MLASRISPARAGGLSRLSGPGFGSGTVHDTTILSVYRPVIRAAG